MAFVHTDHLGSTRLVTDLNKNVVQNLDYLPFGELNSTDSGISTHKFTGDERDAETSFDHTQFRQYTSSLARWISPDRIRGTLLPCARTRCSACCCASHLVARL